MLINILCVFFNYYYYGVSCWFFFFLGLKCARKFHFVLHLLPNLVYRLQSIPCEQKHHNLIIHIMEVTDLHAVMDIPGAQMGVISWLIEVGISSVPWPLPWLPLSPRRGLCDELHITKHNRGDTRWHHCGPGQRHDTALILCVLLSVLGWTRQMRVMGLHYSPQVRAFQEH